jgi:hypothetical protein
MVKVRGDDFLEKRFVLRMIRRNFKNDTIGYRTDYDITEFIDDPDAPTPKAQCKILDKKMGAPDVLGVVTIHDESDYKDGEKERKKELGKNYYVITVLPEGFHEVNEKYGLKRLDEDGGDISEREYEILKRRAESLEISKAGTEVANNNTDLGKNKGLPKIESMIFVVNNPGRNERAWLVINNNFKNNVEFSLKGKGGGVDSYIKTLYNLADNREEEFNGQIATSINSKILQRKKFKGIYQQTTIVEKGNDNKFRKKVYMSIKPKLTLNQEQLQFFPRN